MFHQDTHMDLLGSAASWSLEGKVRLVRLTRNHHQLLQALGAKAFRLLLDNIALTAKLTVVTTK
jgi:hypothetical protein